MDMPTNDANNKPSKKMKPSSQHHPEMFQSANNNNTKSSHEIQTVPNRKGQKGSKRVPGFVNEVSAGFQPERLDSNSVPDSLTSGNEYRVLRRKYLLLEEESFGLGRELKVVEDDIKTLEEEKLNLLDELVVLEGLVDPLDVQPSRP